jgi:hypothetical protein
MAQDGDDFSQVEAYYLFGEYDQALQLLGRMVDTGQASQVASARAEVWRARCLVQKGEVAAALAAFCRVHEIDPNWRPDREIFPANELEVFERALTECVATHEPDVPIESEPPAGVVSPRTQEPTDATPVPLDMRATKTRGGEVVRWLVPGLGQMYKGERTKGTILLVSAAVAVAVAYAGHTQRSGAVDDFEARRDEYLSAVSQAEIDAAYARMEDAWGSVHDAEKLRDIGIYAFVGVYLYNLVDAAVGFPLRDSRLQLSAGATPDGEARLTFCLGARGTTGRPYVGCQH